jgi:hypothetical protein
MERRLHEVVHAWRQLVRAHLQTRCVAFLRCSTQCPASAFFSFGLPGAAWSDPTVRPSLAWARPSNAAGWLWQRTRSRTSRTLSRKRTTSRPPRSLRFCTRSTCWIRTRTSRRQASDPSSNRLARRDVSTQAPLGTLFGFAQVECYVEQHPWERISVCSLLFPSTERTRITRSDAADHTSHPSAQPSTSHPYTWRKRAWHDRGSPLPTRLRWCRYAGHLTCTLSSEVVATCGESC